MDKPRSKLCLLLLAATLPCAARGQDYYYLQARTGAVLDVEAANPAAGTRVQTWQMVGGDNQLWRLLPTPDGGPVWIQSKLGRVLDVEWGSAQTGTPVEIGDLAGGAAQLWTFVASEVPGYFYVRSGLGTYLDSLWGGSRDGVPIWTWDRTGADSQRWRVMLSRRATLTNLGRHCPRGDASVLTGTRDFGGAPNIEVTVRLSTSADRRQIVARIGFRAWITEQHCVYGGCEGGICYDGCATAPLQSTGSWDEVVFTAPAGRFIAGIAPAYQSSTITLVGPSAGPEFYVCADGQVVSASASSSPAIQSVEVIGDTGGDDVSNDDDCGCDAQLRSIEFNPVPIELE